MFELTNKRCAVRGVGSVYLAFGLLVLSASAHALSCIGVDDRFFAQCSNGNCEMVFRARDIPAPGACARRTVVVPVTSDTARAVLERASLNAPSGTYEVTLVHRYYSDPPVSAEELNQAFASHELKAPQVTVKALPTGTSLEQMRDEWSQRALNSLIGWLAYWAFELVLLGAALYTAFRATTAYRRRLQGVNPGPLTSPVALQIAVFGLAVACLGSFTGPVLIGLAAPAVVAVWVYQLGLYGWSRYRRGAAHEP